MDHNATSAEVQETVEVFEENVVQLTREQKRSRRKREVRAETISIKRLAKSEIARGRLEYPEETKHLRPKTRAECLNTPRPCPFVSCAHHLYLDVSPRTGAIKMNYPDLEVEDMTHSCVLDIADRGAETLEQAATVMNVTRERIRQIEVVALAKLEAKESAAVLRDFIDESPLPAIGKRRLPVIASTIIEDDEDEDDGGMSGAPSQIALSDWINKISRTHQEARP